MLNSQKIEEMIKWSKILHDLQSFLNWRIEEVAEVFWKTSQKNSVFYTFLGQIVSTDNHEEIIEFIKFITDENTKIDIIEDNPKQTTSYLLNTLNKDGKIKIVHLSNNHRTSNFFPVEMLFSKIITIIFYARKDKDTDLFMKRTIPSKKIRNRFKKLELI